MGIKLRIDEHYWWESIKPFSTDQPYSKYMTDFNSGNYSTHCIWADKNNVYFCIGSETRTYKQITTNPPQSATNYSSYSVSSGRDIQIIDWTYVYTYNYSWSSQYVYWYKLNTKWDRSSSVTELWKFNISSSDMDYIFKVSMDWKYCIYCVFNHANTNSWVPSLYKLTTPYDLNTMTLIWSTDITAFCSYSWWPIEFLSNWTDYYLFYYTNERSNSEFYIKQAKLNLTTGACSDKITLHSWSNSLTNSYRFSLWNRYKDWNFIPAIFSSNGTTLYYVDCITA